MSTTRITSTSQIPTPASSRPSISFFGNVWRGIKFLFITIFFAIFFTVAAAGIWYLCDLFVNPAYKAVVIFLGLIMVSNVGGKYLIWSLRNWDS